MKMYRGGFVLFFAAMLGFSAQAPESGEAEATREGATTANLAYYIVTHVDMRKCVSPLCGGWFVKRVNRKLTRCADGSRQPECHVLDLDLSAIGLSEEEEQRVEFLWGASHALVRGSIGRGDGGLAYPIDTLKATEAWAGVAESMPDGRFYGVTGSGIVCITYPCQSFTETKLNASESANIHGVDLAASGATDQEFQDGFAELAGSGILVAGKHTTISGPAGFGTALVASEFYSRVLPAASCDPTLICGQALTCVDGQLYPTTCGPANCDKPLGPCGGTPCGKNICGTGELCCNESCGICAPEGGACIQIFCDPTE